MKLSGRNKLKGTVKSVELSGVMARVIIDIGGGNEVTSIITSEAASELGLETGKTVTALIKATSVMVMDS
jgi:molybdopterin-binding protein